MEDFEIQCLMQMFLQVGKGCFREIAKIQAKEALRVVAEDIFVFGLHSTLTQTVLKNSLP